MTLFAIRRRDVFQRTMQARYRRMETSIVAQVRRELEDFRKKWGQNKLFLSRDKYVNQEGLRS